MASSSSFTSVLLTQFKALRESEKVTAAELESRLILGPGWVTSFESGDIVPTIDVLYALLQALGKDFNDLFRELPKLDEKPSEFLRQFRAEESGKDLLVHFPYGEHDATYKVADASLQDFELIIKTLRDGLAKLVASESDESKAVKTGAVADTFLQAVKLWPKANPSDVWYFLINRAYCDPFNHPSAYARLDLSQSWKRTGGWALEEVLVRHYGPFLKTHGINLGIMASEKKKALLKSLEISDRLEADKVDVVLTGDDNGKEIFIGVVYVKASFAERRTDDVPMSKALVEAGYVSPLWTMDCKGTPSANPHNRGELGLPKPHRKIIDLQNEKILRTTVTSLPASPII